MSETFNNEENSIGERSSAAWDALEDFQQQEEVVEPDEGDAERPKTVVEYNPDTLPNVSRDALNYVADELSQLGPDDDIEGAMKELMTAIGLSPENIQGGRIVAIVDGEPIVISASVSEFGADFGTAMVDGETGLTVDIPYMIMGNVAEDSMGNPRKVAKLVRADEQVALMKSLRREGITPNTDPVSMGTAEKAVRPASPYTSEVVKVLSIEDKFNDLSDRDQQLLGSFAFSAANKRSAQLGGYGSESIYHSQEMGRLIGEMNEDAKSIAREYAAYRYGRDEVAF